MNYETSTQFVKAARRVSTPLLSINTLDQQSTQEELLKHFGEKAPCVSIDCSAGIVGLNAAGKKAIAAPHMAKPEEWDYTDPGEALKQLINLPASTAVFMHNAQRFIDVNDVSQGLANLRDPFKANQRTRIAMGPNFRLPAELVQELAGFDEPLPTDEYYSELATKLIDNTNAHREGKKSSVPYPTDAAMRNITTALRGLAAFPA
ncbi:hypothetical protein LCGC14_2575830, partial [marine sediment metagenome]